MDRLTGKLWDVQTSQYGTVYMNTLIVYPDDDSPEHSNGEGSRNKASEDDQAPTDNKPPLVLTHGFGSGLAMYYRNLNGLASRPGRLVYCIDWLGMGRSSRPRYPTRCASHPIWPVDTSSQLSTQVDAFSPRYIDIFIILKRPYSS